jgi:hypothetical protein
MTGTRRPTKAEQRRARADAARAALARAERRAQNIRRASWSGAAVVAVAVVIILVVVFGQSHNTPASSAAPGATTSASTSTSTSPGASAPGRTSNPPWNAPSDAAGAVAAAGLPMLGQEGTAQHIHAHLDVIVNGAPAPVPAEVGIDQAKQQISPLHTHDTSGVIHIESPDASAKYTLGQFFTEWQVSLAADHIGGLTADATHKLVAYVNGKPYTGDPASIVLNAHDEIAIVYGTQAQQTNVPSSYQWTNGL